MRTMSLVLGAGRGASPRPPRRSSRLRWLALVLVGAAVCWGMTVVPDRRDRPTRVLAADYLSLISAPYLPGADAIQPGFGRLAGPHFALRMGAVAVRSEIVGRDATVLNLLPARASVGHEVLFAEIRPPDRRPSLDVEGPPLAHAVWVAGTRRPLPELAKDGAILVVSAPKASSVMLEVNDEGSLRMNLRDGSVSTYYEVRESKLTPSEYHGSGTVRAGLSSEVVTVNVLLPRSAVAEPFVPGLGWARSDRTWLYLKGVSASARGRPFDVDFPDRIFPVSVALDMSASFTLHLPDGTVAPQVTRVPVTVNDILRTCPKFQTTSTSPCSKPEWSYTVFEVPKSFQAGTLRILPVFAKDGDPEVPSTWIAPPVSKEIPIDMRG